MPFTLVCCQVTLKNVQEVFARPVHGACFLQQCVSSCMMCCSSKRRLNNCIRGTFYPFLIALATLLETCACALTRPVPSAEGRTWRKVHRSVKQKQPFWRWPAVLTALTHVRLLIIITIEELSCMHRKGGTVLLTCALQPLASFALPQQSPCPV